MATCPAGHESASDDYCDVCGALMSGPPAPPEGAAPPAGSAPGPAPEAQPAQLAQPERCPDCDTPSTDRFCEVCGYDFVTGAGPTPVMGAVPAFVPAAPPSPGAAGGSASPYAGPGSGTGHSGTGTWIAPGTWLAVVNADRHYYESIREEGVPDSEQIPFPPYCPERRFPLSGPQIRVGRRSVARGFTPEVDLSGPPEDPGVSHMHAVLIARPDGGWTLVDPGSTNGTTVNGGSEPIEVNVPVHLNNGDRVHVGAWTTITLHYHQPPHGGRPPAPEGVSEGVRPQ